jgi:hypothetical protein
MEIWQRWKEKMGMVKENCFHFVSENHAFIWYICTTNNKQSQFWNNKLAATSQLPAAISNACMASCLLTPKLVNVDISLSEYPLVLVAAAVLGCDESP